MEMITTPAGVTVTVLTGEAAVAHMVEVARYCAARGGEVAAEVVAAYEKY